MKFFTFLPEVKEKEEKLSEANHSSQANFPVKKIKTGTLSSPSLKVFPQSERILLKFS